MGNKVPYTPTSQIRNLLRNMWMRSRERNLAIKNMEGRCCLCSRKQSKAKSRDPLTTTEYLEVHHMDGVNWERILKVIREELLYSGKVDRLAPLCRECHAAYDEQRHLKKPS